MKTPNRFPCSFFPLLFPPQVLSVFLFLQSKQFFPLPPHPDSFDLSLIILLHDFHLTAPHLTSSSSHIMSEEDHLARAIEIADRAKLRSMLKNIHPLARLVPKLYDDVSRLIQTKRPHRQATWSKTALSYDFYQWNSTSRSTARPALHFFLACVAAHETLCRVKNDKFCGIVQARGLMEWAEEELQMQLSKQNGGNGDAQDDADTDDDADDPEDDGHNETAGAQNASSPAIPAASTLRLASSQAVIKREAPADSDRVDLSRVKRVRTIILCHSATQTTTGYADAGTQTGRELVRETPATQMRATATNSAEPLSVSTATTLPAHRRATTETVNLATDAEDRLFTMVQRSTEAIEALQTSISDIFMTNRAPTMEGVSVQPQQAQPIRLNTNSRVRVPAYRGSMASAGMPAVPARQRLLPAGTMVEAPGFVGTVRGGGGRIIDYPSPGMAFEADYEDVGVEGFGGFHTYRRGY